MNFFKKIGDLFDKEKMSKKQYDEVKIGLRILIILAVAVVLVLAVFLYNLSNDKKADDSTSSDNIAVTKAPFMSDTSSFLNLFDSNTKKESSSDSDTSVDDSSEQISATGVSVTYNVSNSWENGENICYQVDMNIKNNDAENLSGWNVTLDVAEGTTVEGWSASYDVSGTVLTITPQDFNSEIYGGGSVSIGFILTTKGEINADSIKVSGKSVTVSKGETSGDNNQQQQGGDNNSDSSVADVSQLLERTENAVQGDDWLFTDGNKIVDKDGKQVWITGVNWFGYNTGTNIFDGLWGSELVSSVEAIADHGFNLIRIPFSAQLINQWAAGEYPKANYNQAYNPSLNSMNSLQIFDYVVNLCEQNGVKIMIDIHSAETNASGHTVNLWCTDSVSVDEYYAALEWMADRYKNNDTIVAYDLKNEPHGKPYEGDAAAIWNDSTDANNWKHVAETAASKVLAKNPNVLIMVEGIEIYPKNTKINSAFASTNDDDYYFNWWGGNLRGVADYPIDLGKFQNKLVYSPHDYGPTVYEQPWFKGKYDFDSLMKDCWHDNWFYIFEDNTAPLLIGEWGGFMSEPNITWMTYMRQLIKENNLNHTFWCFNANSGDTGGLVLDDFTTWDEEKYAFVKEVLWQQGGKFVGLDHAIALGDNGITLSKAKGI